MKRILRKSVGILLIVSMLAGMFGSTLASAKTVSQLSAAAHDALNHFIASVDAIEAANAFGQWEFTPGGEDNATNPAGGYNAVIADNTSAGLFLNAAKAFWALMKTDIVRMDHPTHGISDDDAKAFPYNWWAQMYYSFNADFLQWTGSKQILLAALTGMKKNASTTNSDVMVNAFSKTGQYNAGIGTEPANFTLTVTHSDLHALGGLTYAELLELEGGAGTRYTYGMDAAVFTNEGNASARSNYFTRRRAEAIQPLSDGYTEALKAYYDYFMKETNGKRLVDTDLLTLGLDLQSLTDANRAVAGRDGTGTQNAAGVAGMIYKIGPAILRSVLGEDYDTIRNFVKLCEESLEPLQFLEDIQYFYGGGANQMQGMVNLQEGLIVFAARELNHLNETEQRALLTAMDVVYDRLKSVSPKGKTMLEELYGPLYGFESDMASIETARASLLFAIDTQAAKRLKPILNKDVADNSLDGIRYYDVIRDELGNLTVDADGNFVYAADSIVLSGLWARFAANMEELRSLSPDAAGAVVSAEELAQYDALYDALLSEVFQRSLKSNTELKEIFAFFARLRYSGIAQENTDTLLNLIDEAKEKNAAFSAIYHQNKNSLSKDDLARVFGDYPTFIPNATDAILSVLGIRYGTQLDIAARLFEDGGDVDWNNVAIYREMLGGVDGRLRSAILGTVFYTDTMAAKYDIISKIDKQLADFMANGGFDQYPNAWETEYPTRPAMPNDAARNKAYIADHERLAQTMEAIDTLLTGDALSALGLSFDLSETLHGLVPTVLSDSIINAVVGLLYDKVLTKFEDVWAGLPSEQEITDPIATKLTINVASLHNVLTGKNYNGANAASSAGLEAMKTMRLYPDLLAEVLPDTFSEAKEALAALAPADPAKFKTYPSNIWNDPSIRDADGALNLKWGVDELEGDAKVERFKTAFAASMQGLWPLLASLLCGQTYTAYHPQVAAVSGMSGIISGDVTIDLFIKEGNHGFAEALTPVFEALLGTGDNCILTPAELENITTPRQLVDAIIDPLVEFIDKLADAPLSTITAALPNIAYAFSVDRILPLFNNLKLGIEYQPGGTINYLFGNVPVSDHMAGDAISLDVANELLFNGGIDLSFLQHINKLLETVLGGLKDADGAPLNLKLPTFNPGSLAILGTMRNSEDDALETKRFSSVRRYIEADQADVFLYLLRYLFNTLRDDDFYQKIIGLITDSNALSPIVDEILTNARQNPELAIAALVELFAPAEYDMGDIDWIRCEDTTQYSAFWHKEDAQYLAENLAPFIDGLIKLLGIYDENGKLYSVENLNGLIGALGDSLYAPDLLNSLAAALKDLLANAGLPDEVLDIAAALGVDLRAWDSITEDHFRFANGDRAAFVDGLLELLRPLYPLLRFLLTEDFALSLFDGTLNAHSYAGYAYGIIPILEALGVKNILTPAQYTAAAINPDGTVNDNLVLAFLNPLLNTVDEVLANPLPLLLEKLPNAVYFIKSGGLETSVNNILHAVNVILDTVRPLYSVNLTQMLGIDLGLQGITNLLLDIVNTALGSSFELPNNGMVEALAAGKLTAFTSANGKTSYAIAGDQADTITALLRFAVEFLFHQNNRNEVVGLLADLVGTNVDFLKQIDALFSWMRSLEMRICGADLVMINLLNTMKVTNVFVQGKNNLLDTVNKNWVAILDAMKQSDLAFISDAAKSLEAFLDQNFNGVADGGGVISQGVIPAVNTVMSWFQKLWEILTWPFKMLMSWFA